MPLSLLEDLEPYVDDYDEMHASGVYALELERPASLADVWDQHYDTRPPYWSDLMQAEKCLYVGGASDLLSRLEDHRDNEDPTKDTKRQTALTRVCEVRGLHTAWLADSPEHAFEILEPRLARWLQSSHSSWYVHCR